MNVGGGLGLSCIVVHFQSPGTLPATLTALDAAHVPGASTVVVDNSLSDSDSEAARATAQSAGCLFIRVDNRGYAAAANSGLQFLEARGLRTELVLLSTHESLPEPDAVERLIAAFESDPAIAVAGPLLFNSGPVGREVWSAGGRLSRVLKRPRHYTEELDGQSAPVDRAWLDGAFTLYETAVLERQRLDESYFLYFEETDLHVRLARLGRRVVVVPGAHASQSSNGIPPQGGQSLAAKAKKQKAGNYTATAEHFRCDRTTSAHVCQACSSRGTKEAESGENKPVREDHPLGKPRRQY